MKVLNETRSSNVVDQHPSSFRILNKLTLERRIQGIANEAIFDSLERSCEQSCPNNDKCGLADRY